MIVRHLPIGVVLAASLTFVPTNAGQQPFQLPTGAGSSSASFEPGNQAGGDLVRMVSLERYDREGNGSGASGSRVGSRQEKVLASLAQEARAFEQATTEARKDLQAARVELIRRATSAKRKQQWRDAKIKRQSLRRSVQAALAAEARLHTLNVQHMENVRQQAAAAAKLRRHKIAAEAVRQAAIRTAAMAEARKTTDLRRTTALEKARQLAIARAATRKQDQIAAEIEARRLALALAKWRRTQQPLPRQAVPNGKAPGFDTEHRWPSIGIMRDLSAYPKGTLSDASIAADHTGTVKWNQTEGARGAIFTIWRIASVVTSSAARSGLRDFLLPLRGGRGLDDSASPPQLSGRKLVLKLQKELRRVGCRPGELDGLWGPKGRDALDRFADNTDVSLQTNRATIAALEAVKARKRKVCQVECDDDENLRNGRCVEKPQQQQAQRRRVRKSRSSKQEEPDRQDEKPKNDWARKIFNDS